MKEPATAQGSDLKDPDYTPPLAVAIPLGIQHVLAIVLATSAGFGYGSSDSSAMI